MKRIRALASLLAVLCAFSAAAFSQGVIVPPQTAFKVVNGLTTPIANATITVCAAGAAGIPCSPALANSLFKDVALTQPLSNPFTTDANGNYQFAIAPGNYTVTVTATGFNGNSYQFSAGSGTVGSVTFAQVGAGTNANPLLVGTGGSLGTTGSGTIAATSAPFAGVSSGTNTNALTIGNGGSLGASGTGSITATNAPFSGVTGGTNSSAALVIGTGASLAASGSGTITATGAPFSGITSGTNTTGGLLVGTGASLSLTGSGSIISNQHWIPPFLVSPGVSMTTSGGAFLQGHATSIRYTLGTHPTSETYASQLASNSNSTIGCSSGSSCQLTVATPTTPQSAGFTVWSVYGQDCSVSPCGGSETLQASCTNIAIGTNCVLNSIAGGGANVPTTATAYPVPAGAQPSECQPGVQPSIFGQDNAGNYHTYYGDDQYSNNGITAGYQEFCHAIRIIDTVFGPPSLAYVLPFNNAMVDMVHQAGTNTSNANQDRTLAVNMRNPLGDSTTRYGAEVLQCENDVFGHPVYNGSPDGAASCFSGQMLWQVDSSYTAGAPTSGIQAARLDMDYQPASTSGGNAQVIQGVMNASATATEPGGTQLAVLNSTLNGSGWGNAFGSHLLLNWPVSGQTPTSGIAALWVLHGSAPNHTNATGPLDWIIKNNQTGIPSYMNGTVWNGGLQNDGENATLPIVGATTVTPSLTVSQSAATITTPAGTCSGGSSQYTYQYVGVDNNGSQILGTSTLTAATCTNPLTSGNPVTLTTSFPAALVGTFVRFDVYRTGGPMPFGKVGSLTCVSTGWAPSCQAFVDTGLTATGTVPTVNTTGGIFTAGISHFAGNLFVVGSSGFTTANNTSFQTITGLSWTLNNSTTTYSGHCSGAYSQATGNASVAFGIQSATVAPTNIFATGKQQITAATAAAPQILPTLNTTTATGITSGTPAATATNYAWELDFTIENPANNQQNVINIMVSTATGTDPVTVLRDSYCVLY